MSTILVRRPARRSGPEPPDGELSLQEPPVLPEQESSISGVFMYLPMAMSSLAMVMMFMRPGAGTMGTAMPFVAGGMMMVGAVAMVGGQILRTRIERGRRLSGDRRDYLRYLSQMRGRVREIVVTQREARSWNGPAPEALWSLVRTSRLWERRGSHDDFAEVRLAVGEQPLQSRIAPLSTKPVEDLEPLSAHALRRFINAYAAVPDLPVSLYLRGFAHVGLSGDTEAARSMVRAILAQITVFHAPDELRVAACVNDERMADWEWMKWLPHCLHPSDTDGAGAVRMFASDAMELERLIGPEFADRPRFDPQAVTGCDEPFTVIIVDGGAVPQGSRLLSGGFRNAIVIEVGVERPWDGAPYTLMLRMSDEAVEMGDLDRTGKEVFSSIGRPDRLDLVRARSLARLLAPYRVSVAADVVEPLTTDFDLTTLLDIPNLHTWDPLREWERERPETRLRVPIGIASTGAPLELDLKESALGGMGPHGMLIGATGSGKSELLRTLVLSLALTHSSETLNFVLVDFKGGATFIGLDQLNHTSALITNLADETALVERMQDAVHGELVRRQEFLRATGNYSSVHEYEKARRGGAQLEPMPTLFVVVDEFSELLAAHRDFMDLFVMIGRLGRSLGVHLLLASQRLDEGRMHQLESHLSYRIALRTFSAMESRGVLGVPDAHQLPSSPGSGYLKPDTDELVRFKAAYVSGPYRAKRRPVRTTVAAGEIAPFLPGYVAGPPAPAEPVEPEPAEEEETTTLLAAALETVGTAGPPARRVWLPPLDEAPTVAAMLQGQGAGPLPAWGAEETLSVPLGLVDRPFEQLRTPLTADLRGAGGHTAVIGGPQSGKSTLLVSMITALALTNTPAQVQFYLLDFGGGTLRGVADLPHVGGICGRIDTERITRTVAEVTGLLARRERFFADHGLDSMAAYRRRRAAGEFGDEPYGDVFLVIDGWATVRSDMLDMIPEIVQLAQRGLNYGIHLIVASPRWADVQSSLRDLLITRFELRLGDAVDSAINMRQAEKVPRVPGRGMTAEYKHFLTALPHLEESPEASVAGVVEAVKAAWDGPPAPPVRLLPLSLPAADLPPAQDGPKIALGLEERRLEPLWHDFSALPHLLVVGDTESGKTNLLRLVTRTIRERYDASQARVVVVDPRRSLFDAIPEEMRLGYAVTGESAREMMGAAAQALKPRLPGPEVTPEELRNRSWWTGPELFVVIDDYDLLGAGGGGPLAPVMDMLPQGADIGFHLILARGAGGISRAMGDPALRMLIDSNTPSMVLSVPPSEGVLFGSLRPERLPPGRALRFDRRDPVKVQLALDPGTEEEADRS